MVHGWANSNMTVAAIALTKPVLMNGTQGVRLSLIDINASSNGQMIRNVAFNESIAQIEFDRNGTIQLTVNSSVEPSQVYADDSLLSQAQSVSGLTSQSEAWVYDANSHTVTIFADPASVTLIYTATATPITTPVPEYPVAFCLLLIGCLVITLLFAKNSRTRAVGRLVSASASRITAST